MDRWLIVLISISPILLLLLIGLFVVFGLIFEYFYRQFLALACKNSELFIDKHFEFVVFICGKIGAGKTTFAAALANSRTRAYQIKAAAKIDEIINIFHDVDFNNIDAVLKEAYLNNNIRNTDSLISILFKTYPEYEKVFEGNFDGYLVYSSCIDLLRDYIDAQCSLLRNNYVYFPRKKFYSRVTNNYAMNYDPSMINFKDRFLDNNYSLERYTIIFEDEKLLSEKISTNYKSVADEDGGASLFLRLIRQLGKKTITYLTTAQDFARAVLEERELATDICYISSRKELGTCFFKKLVFQISYYFLDKLYRVGFIFKSKKAKIQFSKKVSKLKLFKFRLMQKLNQIHASSFIQYSGILFTKASDVGKNPENCISFATKFKLTFPIQFAYGSVNTFEWAVLNDFLLNASKNTVVKLEIKSDIDMVVQSLLSILKKKSQKKKSKEDDEGFAGDF